jgi:hypothetical protein
MQIMAGLRTISLSRILKRKDRQYAFVELEHTIKMG